MKRIPILGLVKLQLCILTIIMIFCKINSVQLTMSFYLYYCFALALLTFITIVFPAQEEDN